MNYELLKILQESSVLTEKLLILLEEDKEDMCRCIHGSILTEYLKATEETAREIVKIKNSLAVLCTETL